MVPFKLKFNPGQSIFDQVCFAAIKSILAGELPEKDHDTDGYPTFTSWPAAPFSATHQVQYYKWLERAYLSGLRLLLRP